MNTSTSPTTSHEIDAFNAASCAALDLRDALAFMTLAIRCVLEHSECTPSRQEMNGYDTIMSKVNGLANKTVMRLDLLWEAHKGADHE